MKVSDSPHINMIQGDCMEAMAGMEDNAYELAIVDPPYGIREDGHRKNDRSKLAKTRNHHTALWDQERPTEDYFNELKRVSRNQIIWGGNHLTDLINAKSPCWIVWNKKVMSGKGNHFADCELAFTSFDTAVRSFEFEWQGMIQGNMKNKQERIHPTEKPIALYKWILKNYATEGDRILDTHGGSGSIAIACYDMGFDLDWYELDKDYYADAVERFKEHKKQGQLFRPQPKPQAKQGELI